MPKRRVEPSWTPLRAANLKGIPCFGSHPKGAWDNTRGRVICGYKHDALYLAGLREVC